MSNEEIKNKAITELFCSNEIQEKIKGICYRHHIPKDADIEREILQVTFENLAKYNTEKFVEAYTDNPKRIIGLAVRIALTKGVYKDNRIPSGFKNSIATEITHSPTFNIHYNVNDDTSDDFNRDHKNIQLVSDTTYKNEVFDVVYSQISKEETRLLDKILEHKTLKIINGVPVFKLKKKEKVEAEILLKKIKPIIEKFYHENEN